jgi:type IV pilus assembly protein PilV
MTESNRSEAGFTLVEALIAILLLVVGLMAISNLFIVAGSSNQTGSHSTAATTQATEAMERLAAIPFNQLTAGGGTSAANLDTDQGSISACTEPAQDCVIAGNFNMRRWVAGVGSIKTRWQVINPGAAGVPTIFIRVRSESEAPIVGGPRTRAEMTMFRSCTVRVGQPGGCPAP